MSFEMIIVFFVIIISMVFFIWDHWRYDIVAVIALLFITFLGIISFDDAFMGFSHPAVITVAAILVISQGLINSGIVDVLSKQLLKISSHTLIQLFILLSAVTILSAFMNNIGALALLMPIAIRMAHKTEKNPSIFLLPLAFASHFGGWITLIGTPANLIISSFRAEYGPGAFNMFDFSIMGLIFSVVGIIILTFLSKFLIPKRDVEDHIAMHKIEEFLAEVYVIKKSKLVGKRIFEIQNTTDADVNFVTLISKDIIYPAPSYLRILREGDILIMKGSPEDLNLLIEETNAKLSKKKEFKEGMLGSADVSVLEVVIGPHSLLDRRTVKSVDLFRTYHINILAIAHNKERFITRLKNVKLRTGDILIIQGYQIYIDKSISELGLLPLAEREIRIGKPRKLSLALVIFIGAILLTTFNILPVHIAFTTAAITMVIFKIISLQELYHSINWPVIILLAALIPIGLAFESTGGTEFISSLIISSKFINSPHLALILILILSLIMSELIHNVATVIILAPIAINIAFIFNVSVDPFLIAVLIGGSAGFLTPIGHQSNLVVMAPGGYKFSDYWRLGFVIEITIVIMALPLILFLFPF